MRRFMLNIVKEIFFYAACIVSLAGCVQSSGLRENPSKEIQDKGFIGDLYHSGIEKKHPTIIVLGGSEGGTAWNNQDGNKYIHKLVASGYGVLNLAYFKVEGLPESLVSIPLEYFEKVMHWLDQNKYVIPNQYAIIGTSKGAELALLLASRYPQIKTVVAVSPSSVVFQGIQSNSEAKSSWSYNNHDLAFVGYGGLSFSMIKAIATGQYIHVYTKALKNIESVNNATIKVEQIRGPILLLSGKDDTLWPATRMSEQIMARLSKYNFPFAYEHVAYDMGHNLFYPEVKNKMINFLTTHFKVRDEQ